MIELGALLGAVAMMLVASNERWSTADNSENVVFITFIGMPILGALWGAVVAAVIHFAFGGTLLGLVFRATHPGS